MIIDTIDIPFCKAVYIANFTEEGIWIKEVISVLEQRL